MTRLILSFALIAVTLAGVTGATVAYFSSGKVIAGNTFATGNVKINSISVANAPLTLSNLAPGVAETKHIYFQYQGTLQTNVFLGVGGTSTPGQPQYIADHLNMYITDHNTSSYVWSGKASDLSTEWKRIAYNVSPNQWIDLDVRFTLDPLVDNEHQGVTNTDTRLMLYSVQFGAPAPTTKPYEDRVIAPWTSGSF